MKTTIFVLIISSVILVNKSVALDDLFEQLINVKSLKCTFENGTYGNWKGKTVQVKPDTNYTGPSHFDSIDLRAKTARLIGNGGAGNVEALFGISGITFIEETSTGNFSFTTVFPFYKQNTTDFMAVTSRHMNLIKLPLPSQYHGTCKVWE